MDASNPDGELDAQPIQVVRPCVHQAALRKVLRKVVASSDGLRYTVCHLPLDRFGAPFQFVEERARADKSNNDRAHVRACIQVPSRVATEIWVCSLTNALYRGGSACVYCMDASVQFLGWTNG